MSDADRWIVRNKPSVRPMLRLVCLPFAGAGASLYRLWAQSTTVPIEVLRVQLPGREERARESPCTNMNEVISAVVDAVGDGPPVSIFGHSLGGLIAFELALALHELGRDPIHLFIAGARPPHRPDPYQLHRLDEGAFLNALRARGGVQEEILANPDLREFAIPLVRADLELAETWKREAPRPLPIPLTVCAAPDDAVIPWHITAEWASYTTARFERRAFDGDHFFVRTHAALVRDFVFAKLTGLCETIVDCSGGAAVSTKGGEA